MGQGGGRLIPLVTLKLLWESLLMNTDALWKSSMQDEKS